MNFIKRWFERAQAKRFDRNELMEKHAEMLATFRFAEKMREHLYQQITSERVGASAINVIEPFVFHLLYEQRDLLQKAVANCIKYADSQVLRCVLFRVDCDIEDFKSRWCAIKKR